MAPAGIEPTARGLGNRCSIQLSYGAVTQMDGSTVPRRFLAVNAVARFSMANRANPLVKATPARIIHECRREAAETEVRRGSSQVRTTEAYSLRYVEEAEREEPRRARGSDAAVGIYG